MLKVYPKATTNQPGTPADIVIGIEKYGPTATIKGGTLTYTTVQAEVYSNKRPFIMNCAVKVNGQWVGGHTLVTDGYSSSSSQIISYWDPDSGKYSTKTYSALISGSSTYKWETTIYQLR